MPLKTFENLPANYILMRENIDIIFDNFKTNDVVLQIAILNLMPTKEATETQLLRLLGHTDKNIEITLLRMETHISKTTSRAHLDAFYTTFSKVKHRNFDGLIVTGSPIEKLDFAEVTYWEELKQIFNWANENIKTTLNICWGAQAALFHYYGVNKYKLTKKMSGIFAHTSINSPLTKGFDDVFFAPQSRYTEIRREEILNTPQLELLCQSEEAGVLMCRSKDARHVFITGHLEYDKTTLAEEYFRDVAKGIAIEIPKHYFINDDPTGEIVVNWRAHGNLLFNNWISQIQNIKTPRTAENTMQ